MITSSLRAIFLIVANELRAQPARLHSDDRIGPRIEGRFLAEDVHADDVLFELGAASADRFEHDEAQEPLEPIHLLERRAGENALELFPDRLCRGPWVTAAAVSRDAIAPYLTARHTACRQRVSRVSAVSRHVRQ